MATLRTRLSRRGLLALGATGTGLALLAGVSDRAATLVRSAAPAVRPAARSGAVPRCGLCGSDAHTMLGGRHHLHPPRAGRLR
jgi:hypothetical protein